jgi:hypothetical protein
MPTPTNLTEGLAHLRGRKSIATAEVRVANEKPPAPKKNASPKLRGRRMSVDYFSLFVYSLLCVAVVSQLLLLVWYGR